MQGVEFEQVHVDISDDYKAMYDAAAALWLEVKEAIDSCKETGLIQGSLVKVNTGSQHGMDTFLPCARQARKDQLCAMHMVPFSGAGCFCNLCHLIAVLHFGIWVDSASIHSILANSNPPVTMPGLKCERMVLSTPQHSSEWHMSKEQSCCSSFQRCWSLQIDTQPPRQAFPYEQVPLTAQASMH